MVAVLKQVGKLTFDSCMLKTSTSWLAHVYSSHPCRDVIRSRILTETSPPELTFSWGDQSVHKMFLAHLATWPRTWRWRSCFCHCCFLWWSGSPATYLWCWGLSPVSPDVSALPAWCQLSVSIVSFNSIFTYQFHGISVFLQNTKVTKSTFFFACKQLSQCTFEGNTAAINVVAHKLHLAYFQWLATWG